MTSEDDKECAQHENVKTILYFISQIFRINEATIT